VSLWASLSLFIDHISARQTIHLPERPSSRACHGCCVEVLRALRRSDVEENALHELARQLYTPHFVIKRLRTSDSVRRPLSRRYSFDGGSSQLTRSIIGTITRRKHKGSDVGEESRLLGDPCDAEGVRPALSCGGRRVTIMIPN
jgi:hypothetical protein